MVFGALVLPIWLCVALLNVWLCVASLNTTKLELNPGSTVFKDILSVTHKVDVRQIDVSLQPASRCRSPTFVVRLSGTSLMLADLVTYNESVYTYQYPCILDPGRYFIEVATLFCNRFNPSNYTGICMENVSNNGMIVNLPYATNLKADGGCEHRPRWKLGAGHKETTFLPTHYQRKVSELSPKEYCNTGIITGFCNPSKVDISEYSQYKWTNGPNWRKAAPPAIALAVNPQLPVVHMCYVGDSHSMHLARQGNSMAGLRSGLTHEHLMKAVPSMFNVADLAKRKCSVAIVSFGQWMFGNGKHAIAITREKYASELRKLIAKGGLTKDSNTTTRVYFRTENYNGLGARYTACPPLDYRSMRAMDMIIDVVRELSAELNLNLVDLTHIQKVHWDSAPDFNHPGQNVIEAELNWILHYVFDDVVRNKVKLTTYAAHDTAVALPPHDGAQYRIVLNEALAALDLPP